MARKIASTEEAAEQSDDGSGDATPKGVTFIKNQPELIRFDDGTTFKFDQSKQTITDPVLIAKLRSVAERCHILEA